MSSRSQEHEINNIAFRDGPERFYTFQKVWFSKLFLTVRGKELSYLEGLLQHPGQKEIHFGTWQYYVAMWGRRTGKTIAAAALVVAYLALPNTRIWIVAPNYELTDRVFEYVYRWVVIDKILGTDAVLTASQTDHKRYIKMRWGSFVKGKSAEAPASLVGDQLDLLIIDEAARIPEIVWIESLEPTTLDRMGRVLFISTPRGRNWFYRYFLRRLDPETIAAGWSGSRFMSQDNPFVDNDWLESKRKQTAEAIFNQEYNANPDDFAGLVFPDYRDRLFTEGGHLFDPQQTPMPDGTDYRAGDIGFRHPTVWLWGRVDREDNLWVHRMYKATGVDHETHAKAVRAMSQDLRIYDGWISPDAERKFAASPTQQLSAASIYRDHGVHCRPANDNVKGSISELTAYLRASIRDSDHHPKIFFSKELKELREAFDRYVWAEVPGRIERDQPEQPKKYRDDEIDALRYLTSGKPSFVPEWLRQEYQPKNRQRRPSQRVLKSGPIVAGNLYG